MSTESYQVVKVFDKHVEVEIGGMIKTITIPDFKESLDRCLQEEQSIDPIILPRNVLTFGKTASSIEMNTYWPEAVFDVKFVRDREETNLKIPFPNIIIHFVLRKESNGLYSVNSAKYFCTPLGPGQLTNLSGFINKPDATTKIFPMPLPNVYNDFRACYGHNSMPGGFGTDFRALDWYYLFLKDTPFNTDLSIHGVKSGYRDPVTWMKFLDNKTAFPYDFLVAPSISY